MTSEAFRILMEQRMRDWLRDLETVDLNEAWCVDHEIGVWAVESFLKWVDAKEMEL